MADEGHEKHDTVHDRAQGVVPERMLKLSALGEAIQRWLLTLNLTEAENTITVRTQYSKSPTPRVKVRYEYSGGKEETFGVEMRDGVLRIGPIGGRTMGWDVLDT